MTTVINQKITKEEQQNTPDIMTGFGFNVEIGSIASPTSYPWPGQSHVFRAKNTIESPQIDRWEMTHNLPVTPRHHDVGDGNLPLSWNLVKFLSRDVETAVSWSLGPLTFDTYGFLARPPFQVGTCTASWHPPYGVVETERHECCKFFVDISLPSIFLQFV